MRKLAYCALVALVVTTAAAQQSDTTDVSAQRKRILETAYKYRGVPYVYGAESPRAFDCSGFVRYVYREASGMELPRSARGFYSAGAPVKAAEARPGDVFVYDTVGGSPSHVAIYVGDGKVIHAVSDGPKTGVIVSSIHDRYWSPRLIAARTFLPTETIVTAPAAPAAPAVAKAPLAAPVVAEQQDDVAIADIGFTIRSRKESYTDKIPAEAGTSVAFTLTNGTGADGTFMVVFFRIAPQSYKLHQIHEEKVLLARDAAFSLPPFRFDQPGKYRLIVRDNWGNPLFERSFMVTPADSGQGS